MFIQVQNFIYQTGIIRGFLRHYDEYNMELVKDIR